VHCVELRWRVGARLAQGGGGTGKGSGGLVCLCVEVWWSLGPILRSETYTQPSSVGGFGTRGPSKKELKNVHQSAATAHSTSLHILPNLFHRRRGSPWYSLQLSGPATANSPIPRFHTLRS
jgi:hypothetical protein